jgi:hypothetical protein
MYHAWDIKNAYNILVGKSEKKETTTRRMSGAIHPLPQYAFMAWCVVKKHRDAFTFTFILPPPGRPRRRWGIILE